MSRNNEKSLEAVIVSTAQHWLKLHSAYDLAQIRLNHADLTKVQAAHTVSSINCFVKHWKIVKSTYSLVILDGRIDNNVNILIFCLDLIRDHSMEYEHRLATCSVLGKMFGQSASKFLGGSNIREEVPSPAKISKPYFGCLTQRKISKP